MADLKTRKTVWNSVISTSGAQYNRGDIESMYLQTPMKQKQYMHILIDIILQEFCNANDLDTKANNGLVNM